MARAALGTLGQLDRLYPAVQVLNVLGIVWGFAWYWPNLQHTAPWMLVFVPDCPFAALLLALALWRWRAGRSEALQGAAIGIALFYSAWTIALLSRSGPVPAGGLLLAAHIGLGAEAAWLWRVATPQRGWRFASLWIAVNTFADYALGLHPPLPPGVPLSVVAVATALGAMAFAALAPALEPAR